jgi:hypothetical protein
MKQWRDKHDFNKHNQQNTAFSYSQNNLWQSYYESQKQIEQSRRNKALMPIQLANLLEQHFKICIALHLNNEADKAFQQACQIRLAEERKLWQKKDII